MTRWADLFPVTALEQASTDPKQPLLLSAGPGAAEHAFMDLVRPGPRLTLDARRHASEETLVIDLVDAVIRYVAPSGTLTISREYVERLDLLAIASAFPDPAAAIAVATGSAEAGMTFDEALRGVPEGVTVVLEHAHRLWDRRPLWTLRAYAQEGLSVVLTARPHAARSLASEKEAFFGFARTVELPATVNAAQAEPLYELPSNEVEWLLERTQHLRGPFAEVAATIPSSGGMVAVAFEFQTSMRATSMEAILTLAQQVTPWGARILAAVARGERPYRAAGSANPSRSAQALRLLQNADLIYQPQPRQWALADPFLAEAIRVASRPVSAPPLGTRR